MDGATWFTLINRKRWHGNGNWKMNQSIHWSINKMASVKVIGLICTRPVCFHSSFSNLPCYEENCPGNPLVLQWGQNPCRAEPVRLDHLSQTTLPGSSLDQLTPRQPTGMGAKEVVKIKHYDIVVICYKATASQYNYTSSNSGKLLKSNRKFRKSHN